MTGRQTTATAVLAVIGLLVGCTTTEPSPSMLPTTPVQAAVHLEEFARSAIEDEATAVVFHVQDGAGEAAKAYGVRELVSSTPAQATDKLWISGLGTSMLAVSVMKLVEDGRVSLDDRVAEFLPELSAIFPESTRVTVRELLGSRSGLPDYVLFMTASMPLEQLQHTVVSFEERLHFAATGTSKPSPLSEAEWSATDWEVLAWLVERLRKRPLAEVLETDVFEPSGMTMSLVASPGQPPEPMLHGYVNSNGKNTDFTRVDAFAGSGDAGIISSVVDVNRFFRALPTGQLIKADTWQQMSASNPYDLGITTAEDICPGMKHLILFGGGGPYTIGAIADVNGNKQAAIAVVLPPSSLDATAVPDLALQMGEALRKTASARCP